jgi:hypothetical protein
MTMALCFNCGDIKFGAICPCPTCEAKSTGNMGLDITFSDHNIDEASLKELGLLIQKFKTQCNDQCLVFWAFIRYISENHPHILSASVPNDIEEDVNRLYESTSIPSIEIKPSWRCIPPEKN